MILKEKMGHQAPEALIPLEKALELQPGNPEWLRELVECYQATDRWEDVERLLSSHLDLVDDQHRPGFLLLRGRALGKHLDRRQEAIDVLRQALHGDPENIQAAELLLEQLDIESITDPEQIAEAIELHRFLFRGHPQLVDSLRAVRMLCERAGRIDESYNAESCLVLLGEANEEESYFHRQRKKQAPIRPSGALEDEQLHRVALPAGDHPVRDVLLSLRAHLNELISVDLGSYGLESLQSTILAEDHRARETVTSCAQVVLCDAFEVVEALGGTPCGATEPGDPPILLLPESILRLPVPDQRFLIGRLMTRLALGTESLDPGRSDPLNPRDLELLLVALQRTEDAEFGADLAPASILDDMVRRLRELASDESIATAREAARRAFEEQHRGSLVAWIRSTELGACRGGLLCCGSISAASSVLTRASEGPLADDLQRDLIAFSISQEHATLRQALGLALKEH
jgi:tetratricopeptide (TPR) repeat protein